MHIVTKILVVFAAIFSVLLSALTLAFATNADALKTAVKDKDAVISQLRTDLRDAVQVEAERAAALARAKEAAEEALSRSQNEMKALQNERATLKTQVETARFAEQSVQNQVTKLTATSEANAGIIKALNDELVQVRGALVAGSRREAELVDRLNDLEQQRQVLEQSTRALQEQLAEARLAVNQAKQNPGGTTATNVAFVDRGPIVRARVVKVTVGPLGDFAEINEGANLNLKPNQKLTILRDGNFVANLVLTQVEAQSAVGKVDKLGRTVEIRADDIVLSRSE